MVYVNRELRKSILKFRNMMRIFSATEEDRLDPIYREVQHERIQDNFLNIIPSSIILLFFAASVIVYNVISGITVKSRLIFIVAFLIFIFNTLIILKYINYNLSKDSIPDKKKEIICYVYWTIFTISTMTFSILEMIDSGTTNHFFIFIFALSLWPVIEPIKILPYYIIGLALQTFFIYKTGGGYPTYMFCYFISFIGIIATYVKYLAYMIRKISNKRLERISEVDPLTGLLNRRGMQRSVEGIWEYCKSHQIPLTIALLDIDFFKMYNDKYGHSCGDECLKRISTCIKSCFSRRTDITCRFGGEEFVIILAGESENQAVLSFLNLQNKIEQLKIKSGNIDFNEFVTVSIGVCSTMVNETSTIDEMLKIADDELYNAKAKGRMCLSSHGELYNNKRKNDC